jgi:catechol 2,3-dioxygenase-like lactoylglutathione lyase family enzyme
MVDHHRATGAWPTGARHAHVGVVTCDIDRAVSTLTEQFGLAFPPPDDFAARLLAAGSPVLVDGDGRPVPGAARVVTSTGGPMRVEVLEGLPGSVWHCEHVLRLHHLAYAVDDVADAAEPLLAAGWRVEVTLGAPDGRPRGFAYLQRPGEARIELTTGGG